MARTATRQETSAPSFLAGTAFLFICSVVGLAISYFVRVLYARSFGPADFGLLYAVITWLLVLALARNLGLSDAVTYFVSRHSDDVTSGRRVLRLALMLQILFGLVLFLALLVLAPWIANTFVHDARATELLILFGAAYAVVGITEAVVAYFRGRQKLALFGLAEPVRLALILGFSLLFLSLRVNLKMVAIAWLAAYAVSAALALVFIALTERKERMSSHKKVVSHSAKDIMAYALPSFLAAAGLLIFYNVDTLIITALQGTYANGLYNAALPIASALLIISIPISSLLLPTISSLRGSPKKKLTRESATKIEEKINVSLRVALLSCILIATPLLLLGKSILLFLFGAEYLPALVAFDVLIFSAIVRAVVEVLFAALGGLGAANKRAQLLGIGLVINIILTIIGVLLFGIVGAAFAALIAFFIMVLLVRGSLEKEGITFPRMEFTKLIMGLTPLVIVIALSFLPFFYSTNLGLLGIVLVGSVTALLCIAWFRLSGLVTVGELKEFYSFIKERIARR